jgi:uncharacterized protein YukE
MKGLMRPLNQGWNGKTNSSDDHTRQVKYSNTHEGYNTATHMKGLTQSLNQGWNTLQDRDRRIGCQQHETVKT